MKKIISILTLFVIALGVANATQYITVVLSGTSQTVGFRVNNVSGTYRYSHTTTNNSASTTLSTTASGNYRTFSVSSGTTNNNANKTIQISMPDGVNYLEVTSGQTNITSVRIDSATKLVSLNLSGCTSLTSLTMATSQSTLADVNVSNTNATLVGLFNATNAPSLESFIATGCSLTSFSYAGTGLQYLDVSNNSGLTSVDLSPFTLLDYFRCENTGITTLSLPESLTTLSAKSSKLSTLTTSANLQVADVESNELTSISVSNAALLTDLDVANNKLNFQTLPATKPTRVRYTGQDYTYPLTDDMTVKNGYTYPLQAMLPSYSERNNAKAATIDVESYREDAEGTQNVSISFENGSGTALAVATSASSTDPVTVSDNGNLYGFLSAQSQVRGKFTSSVYDALTLYSGYFTVPTGVKGTLRIVSEDGDELYTRTKVFSDATDVIDDTDRRDFTKYTPANPAAPTTENAVVEVTASASDDAPFAWAKTYNDAIWYYLGDGTQWVTTNSEYAKSSSVNGHYGFTDSHAEDNTYMFAFVGNQYEGFKVYNRAEGNSKTLQDNSGYWVIPVGGGNSPVFKDGSTYNWIVRTNSAKSGGFSLQWSDQDIYLCRPEEYLAYSNGFLYGESMVIPQRYQNDAKCWFTVEYAAGSSNATVTWHVKDATGAEVASITSNHASGETVSAYPTELTNYDFVVWPTLTAFTVNGNMEKNVTVSYNYPFTVSTSSSKTYYNLQMRGSKYVTTNLKDDGALAVVGTQPTEWKGIWYVTGNPFQGFNIYSALQEGKALAALNGNATDGSSFPQLSTEPTAWTFYDHSAVRTNAVRVKVPGSTASYWNQYNYYGGVSNESLRYWDGNSTGDDGSSLVFVEVTTLPSTVPITWSVVNNETGEEEYTYTEEYSQNGAVSFPSDLEFFENCYVSYTNKGSSYAAATAPRTETVNYDWTGPFQFSNGTEKHTYYLVAASSGYLTSELNGETVGAEISTSWTKMPNAHSRWLIKGNPFNGVRFISLYDESTGISTSWGWYCRRTSSPTSFIAKSSSYGTNCFKLRRSVDDQRCVTSRWDYNDRKVLYNWSEEQEGADFAFYVEEANPDDIITSGYYQVRNNRRHDAGSENYLTHYAGSYEQWLGLAYSSDIKDTWVRFEEQENGRFHLSYNGYYLVGIDGTSYGASPTISDDESNAFGCRIEYHSTAGTFQIKISDTGSFSYMAQGNSDNQFLDTWTSGDAGVAWIIDPITASLRSVDNETYYGTAYMPFDYTLPEGVEGHVITVDGTTANTDQLAGSVPSGTGILFKANDITSVRFGYKGYQVSTDDQNKITSNVLTGTYTDKVAAQDEAFTFQAKNGQVGFYKYTAGKTLSAYKAYIPGSVASSGVRGFVINFGGGEATPIEFVFDDAEASAPERTFDLQGRRVTKPQKGGIYIINGKKVYVR